MPGSNRFFIPGLKAVVNGQTAVRYLRFLRPVDLDRLELRPVVAGRWVPNVPDTSGTFDCFSARQPDILLEDRPGSGHTA